MFPAHCARRRGHHLPDVCLALCGVNGPWEEAMANALTAVRLLLVFPFAFFMAQGDRRSAIFALLAWVLALITDVLDGPIARRRGTVTAWSGTFDHTTDFLFVTSGLFAGALRGAFPWILPVLITAAFAQYVIDSYWIHRHTKLRGSKLGRYNGMLYFVPTCMDISHPNGAYVFAARAYDPGLVADPEHTGIDGPTADVEPGHRATRTAPGSPAGEIAGPVRR